MKISLLQDKKNKLTYFKYEKIKLFIKFYLTFFIKNSNQNDLINFIHFYEKFIKIFPKKSSISKSNNRCRVSGRCRSTLNNFRLSRIQTKHLIENGDCPGWKPANW